MKKLTLLFLVFVLSSVIYAQNEPNNYKSVSNQFMKFYNSGTYDSVFTMFADIMKTHLPLEKTVGFLGDLKKQVGNISKMEFLRMKQSYCSYKTKFDNGLLELNISLDNDSKLNAMFIKQFVDENLPVLERNTTKMILPFNDEWTVFWGGDTKEQNYHIDNPAQKNAFDFLIFDSEGKSFRNSGENNSDYYCFGKELFAPCDGEVVLAVDGVKDNKPGIMNPVFLTGNTVILKTANNEYLFFAHFKQFSVKVKQGEKVKQGQLLGLCGNSGNSSEAHLHFHIQNGEDLGTALGAKCYFEKIKVNGEIKNDYSPVQKDKIQNVK